MDRETPAPGPDFARVILDSATDFAIFTSDANGILTSWNVGAQAIFGWTPSQAIGMAGAELFTPEDREAGAPTAEMKRALVDGRSVNERWHVRKDQSRFWGSGLLMPLRGGAGGFVKLMQDRTAERAAQRRFHTMTATLPGFVFTADIDGNITETNELYRKYTGRSEAGLNGDRWLDSVHPEDRQRLSETWRSAVETGEPFKQRFRIRHADGEYRCFDCRALPERDEQDRIVRWLGTCIDVEAEARAHAQLERLNRDLEQAVDVRTAELHAQVQERMRAEDALRQSQKMEAIGQLTGGVAHDFNNLLTIIRSSADLLRRGGLSEDKHRRYVDAIADTADRAAKLTSQLLAFARRQALKPEVFDTSERVREIQDMLKTIVGSRVELVIEDRCDGCTVVADPTQFETALVNMAANARDAMDAEGRLTIGIATVSEVPARRGHAVGVGDFVAISVADTGQGIHPDELKHIFEPFFTTKEVGKGTGLGLSQVFGFAKQSGGEVDVQSRVGEGTKFTIYLPRTDAQITVETKVEPIVVSTPARGRVLVVEDNQMVGEFAARLLEELGYETCWVSNAREALDLLNRSPGRFAVVFTDVVMPGMSGIDLAEKIKERDPEQPLVLTSGYSHVLAEKGTHGFELLQKPYSAESLSRVLRRVATR
jgi:PAS domain S-box-containing protein